MKKQLNVQRYDATGCPEQICRADPMYKSADGDYVLYEDYEALQADCEKLQSHPPTWRALGHLIISVLQYIKDKGGLYDFAFQCDEETNTPAAIDRNEIVARVFVRPTIKTAEFTELNFILTGTRADFKEII